MVLFGAFWAFDTMVNVVLNTLAELGAKMICIKVFCKPVTRIESGPFMVNAGSPLRVADVITKSLEPPL